MLTRKSFVRLLVVAAAAMAVAVPVSDIAKNRLLPYGVVMNPPDGSQAVDPRNPLAIRADGIGARLAEVKVYDGSGRLLAEGSGKRTFDYAGPLDFGTRYRILTRVERTWNTQTRVRELTLSTVERPNLEGPVERVMAPDGSISLHFDRPVGQLNASGPATFSVQADEARQTFRLYLNEYLQGETLPLDLHWTTSTGVPVPSARIAVATPPALTAEIFPKNLSNLGLALPIQITFSEPLNNRSRAGESVEVRTADGVEVAGKWSWVGKKRLQFKPDPAWPASSDLEIKVQRSAFRSEQGGVLDQRLASKFSTGTDRHIFVYLDAQRMAAVENGHVVKTFKVSTGKAKTPTVVGSFYIYARFPIKTMRSRAKPGQPGHYVVENVPFAQYFHADYAFHGAWWHNGFGSPASHGCVNMSTRKHNKRWPSAPEDAGWLYQWASLGVPVTVVRSAPPEKMAMQ